MSEWLPEDALKPLSASLDEDSPLGFADRALRAVLPLGLEASGLKAAADAAGALGPLQDDASLRRAMFGLEKLARAHAAPSPLVRAAHGVCACALGLELVHTQPEEVRARARAQLVSALVRLVTATHKAGAAQPLVVRLLAVADATG